MYPISGIIRHQNSWVLYPWNIKCYKWRRKRNFQNSCQWTIRKKFWWTWGIIAHPTWPSIRISTKDILNWTASSMIPTPSVTFFFYLLTLSYISCQMPTELSILHCKKTLRTIWCTSTQCTFIWIEIFIDLLFWFLYAVCWIEICWRWYFTFQNWIQIFYIIRCISQCFNLWKLRISRDVWNTITKCIVCCNIGFIKVLRISSYRG